MTIAVISQSMYLPWIGLLNQIKLADIYIHYDDVQLSRGFYNRVQVNSKQGSSLITIPLTGKKHKQRIDETIVNNSIDWVQKHRKVIYNSLSKSPYFHDAINIFDLIHKNKSKKLSDINQASILALGDYCKILPSENFYCATDFSPIGKSSERLLDICKKAEVTEYLTGHGALNYLDHALFEKNGIDVYYINYNFKKYIPSNSFYTPYVSALDPIANLGDTITSTMLSKMIHWTEAIKCPEKLIPL